MSRFLRVFAFLLWLSFVLVDSLPTMYKVNENRVFEKDLVPVSSTVIPLAIYRLTSNGHNVESSQKNGKLKKPEGPVSLVTAHSPKKAIPEEKKFYVKEVPKKGF